MIYMPRALRCSLLCALLLISPAMAADQLPGPAIPDGFGVCLFRPSWNQEEIGKIASIGFRMIRTGLGCNHKADGKGAYDFSTVDSLMTMLDEKGIRPIFALNGNNFDGGVSPHTDAGRNEFARYAGSAAAHFKGRGVIWKIWNEPNLAQYWKPKPSAEDYTRLVIAASKAIHAADPKAIAIGPNMCGNGFGFLEKCCKLGLLDHIDAVSVHPYSCKTPEAAIAYYKTVLDVTRRYSPAGKELPIVCEEWGFTSDKGMTPEQQAAVAVRMMLVNQMCGVRLTAWFSWLDKGDKPPHHYGLASSDQKPKPSYNAMRTLIQQLKDYHWENRIQPFGDDYVLLFKNGGKYKIAIWTAGQPHRITIPLDTASARIVSLDGKERTANTSNSRIELDITSSVQYVEPVGQCPSFEAEPHWKWSANVK